MKPSELTPLSALMLAALFKEAGFPDGVLNVVTGYGHTAGQALVEHPLVGKVAFTGSTLIGRKIMETAAKTNLKRVTLELGGKSPAIVFDDADISQAVKWIVGNVLYVTSQFTWLSVTGILRLFCVNSHHNGQICTAPTRLFVQEGVHQAFLDAFTAAAKSLKHGDTFDRSVQQGPLVSNQQLDVCRASYPQNILLNWLQRVLGYIEHGKREGARLVAGGERYDRPGFFIRPTIFTDVKPDMKIVREEIFGPVAVVVKFKSEEEVIDMANDTDYGLSSYVFTQNVNTAIRVANALEAGNTFVRARSTWRTSCDAN